MLYTVTKQKYPLNIYKIVNYKDICASVMVTQHLLVLFVFRIRKCNFYNMSLPGTFVKLGLHEYCIRTITRSMHAWHDLASYTFRYILF